MLEINPKKTKVMVFQKCTKKCDYVFHRSNEMIADLNARTRRACVGRAGS